MRQVGDPTREDSESHSDVTDEYDESGSENEVSGSDSDGTGESGDDSGSETEDYETEGETEASQDSAALSQPSTSQPTTMDYSSESGGEEREVCPICLVKFRNQDVGSPESCDHSFCLECITEWSKNVNTCPIDRQTFKLIFARHSLDGVIFKRIVIPDREQMVEEVEEVDRTACEVCARADREDRLLLCDGCDNGYHLECLTPPLSRVPRGEWFCPVCTRLGLGQAPARTAATVNRERAAARGQHVMDEQVGRTMVAERVRAVIRRTRAQRIISDGEDSDFQPEYPETAPRPRAGPSSISTRRRKTTKRRTTKKRKTTRRKKTTSRSRGKTSTTKTRRTKKGGKRRTKKSRARTKRLTPSTSKTRLADSLGLCRPPPGRSIPLVRTPRAATSESQRHDIGVRPLSLFGSWEDYTPFSDGEQGGGGVAVANMAPARVGSRTKAALKFHSPIRPSNRRRVLENIAPPTQCESSFDLLGDIMKGQSMLAMKTHDIKIQRDGSLKAIKRNNDLMKNGTAKYRKMAGAEDGDGSPEQSPPAQQDSRDSPANTQSPGSTEPHEAASTQHSSGSSAGGGDETASGGDSGGHGSGSHDNTPHHHDNASPRRSKRSPSKSPHRDQQQNMDTEDKHEPDNNDENNSELTADTNTNLDTSVEYDPFDPTNNDDSEPENDVAPARDEKEYDPFEPTQDNSQSESEDNANVQDSPARDNVHVQGSPARADAHVQDSPTRAEQTSNTDTGAGIYDPCDPTEGASPSPNPDLSGQDADLSSQGIGQDEIKGEGSQDSHIDQSDAFKNENISKAEDVNENCNQDENMDVKETDSQDTSGDDEKKTTFEPKIDSESQDSIGGEITPHSRLSKSPVQDLTEQESNTKQEAIETKDNNAQDLKETPVTEDGEPKQSPFSDIMIVQPEPEPGMAEWPIEVTEEQNSEPAAPDADVAGDDDKRHKRRHKDHHHHHRKSEDDNDENKRDRKRKRRKHTRSRSRDRRRSRSRSRDGGGKSRSSRRNSRSRSRDRSRRSRSRAGGGDRRRSRSRDRRRRTSRSSRDRRSRSGSQSRGGVSSHRSMDRSRDRRSRSGSIPRRPRDKSRRDENTDPDRRDRDRDRDRGADKDASGSLRMFRQTMKEVTEDEERFMARKGKEDTFQHLHDLATGKKSAPPGSQGGPESGGPAKIQPLMSVKTDNKDTDSQDDDDIEYVTEEIDLHSFGLPMAFGNPKEMMGDEDRPPSRNRDNFRGRPPPPPRDNRPPSQGGMPRPPSGPPPGMSMPPPHPGGPPPHHFFNQGRGILGTPPVGGGGPPLPPGPPPPHGPPPPDMVEMPPPLPDGVRPSNLVAVPQVMQLPPGGQLPPPGHLPPPGQPLPGQPLPGQQPMPGQPLPPMPQSVPGGGQILINPAQLPPNHPLSGLRPGIRIQLPQPGALPPGMIQLGPRGIPVPISSQNGLPLGAPPPVGAPPGERIMLEPGMALPPGMRPPPGGVTSLPEGTQLTQVRPTMVGPGDVGAVRPMLLQPPTSASGGPQLRPLPLDSPQINQMIRPPEPVMSPRTPIRQVASPFGMAPPSIQFQEIPGLQNITQMVQLPPGLRHLAPPPASVAAPPMNASSVAASIAMLTQQPPPGMQMPPPPPGGVLHALHQIRPMPPVSGIEIPPGLRPLLAAQGRQPPLSAPGGPPPPSGASGPGGPPPPPGPPPFSSMGTGLTRPPPPLPAKALQEMQQISNILNAQAKLAQLGPKDGSKPGEGPLSLPSGVPMAAVPAMPQLPKQSSGFKVPLPPGAMSSAYDEYGDSDPEDAAVDTHEMMDMEVDSPLSDTDALVQSFSPPDKGRGRRRDKAPEERKQAKDPRKAREVHFDLGGSPRRKGGAALVLNDASLSKEVSRVAKATELPSSAVQLDRQDKYLRKLNRQERVVEEVKQALKPHFARKRITKDDYKEIMRKAVPKIYHSKSGDINPERIRGYVQAYVDKVRQAHKYQAKKRHPHAK